MFYLKRQLQRCECNLSFHCKNLSSRPQTPLLCVPQMYKFPKLSDEKRQNIGQMIKRSSDVIIQCAIIYKLPTIINLKESEKNREGKKNSKSIIQKFNLYRYNKLFFSTHLISYKLS